MARRAGSESTPGLRAAGCVSRKLRGRAVLVTSPQQVLMMAPVPVTEPRARPRPDDHDQCAVRHAMTNAMCTSMARRADSGGPHIGHDHGRVAGRGGPARAQAARHVPLDLAASKVVGGGVHCAHTSHVTLTMRCVPSLSRPWCGDGDTACGARVRRSVFQELIRRGRGRAAADSKFLVRRARARDRL